MGMAEAKWTDIQPPAGGWHEDTESVLGDSKLTARAIKASEAFDIEGKYSKNVAKLAQAVLNKVVAVDGDTGKGDVLLELPLADYSHIQDQALVISGMKRKDEEPEDDPK